jgi:hypothetical protein
MHRGKEKITELGGQESGQCSACNIEVQYGGLEL